ncbi:GAK system ATP-grasp enzyme [Ectothiorhodospiraceae bacterium BW-2]|nr:GAK system ATP-grasp enzyme [Ectothiorhodospiraceae bacterium BW-2]
MSRVAVIGIPGSWSTETLADAVEASGRERIVVDMGEVVADMQQGTLLFQGIDLCQLDGLLVKKISADYSPHTLDRLELLRLAEAAGVRVFSPAIEILRLVDRLSCTTTLRNGAIPMPPTTLCESIPQAVATIQRYGEAVLKPLYSTKARGMVLLHADEGETALTEKLHHYQRLHPLLYIQQKIALPGRDLGMVFMGGEYLGTYTRIKPEGSWNSTIHSGGRYGAYEATAELIELAQRAQALFKLDFTTVDIVETAAGPMVFEVSAFGGFRGLKEGLGIDVAERYVDYVLQQLKRS